MRGFVWRMAACLALLTIGLGMVFYGLERMTLITMSQAAGQPSHAMPVSLRITLFVGLVLINLPVFDALTRWARFVRSKPDMHQPPVSLQLAVLVVSGGAFVFAFASHAAYLRSLSVVPLDVEWGYICFQIVAAAAAIVALVLLGVRWSPGYHRKGVRR